MWTSAGPADRHSWRPKPGPTSPPSADRRRPGTRGARPPARRSRWAPTPADRPGPGRLPARSWCVAHPGGPVKPPAVPRAARRIRPSRCRPRKPADRGARLGRHRGAPDSNWAMRRRTAGLPPAAAAAASPAGSRRHGPAPHQAATSKGSVRCGSEPSVPLQCSAARAIWPIAAARFVDNVVAVDSAAGKITSWVGVNYSASSHRRADFACLHRGPPFRDPQQHAGAVPRRFPSGISSRVRHRGRRQGPASADAGRTTDT